MSKPKAGKPEKTEADAKNDELTKAAELLEKDRQDRVEAFQAALADLVKKYNVALVPYLHPQMNPQQGVIVVAK